MAIINKDLLGVKEASNREEILSRRQIETDVNVGCFATRTGVTAATAIRAITAATNQTVDGLVLRDSDKESVVANANVLAADKDNYVDLMTKGEVYARAAEAFTASHFGANVKVTATGMVVPGSSVTAGYEINAYPLTVCPAPSGSAGDDTYYQAVKLEILGL